MTYYDHAAAIAYKLDQWGEPREPRNFELEQIARERRTSTITAQKRTILRRYLALFRTLQP